MTFNPVLTEALVTYVSFLYCWMLWTIKHQKVNKNYYYYNKDYFQRTNKEYQSKHLDDKRARYRRWYKAHKDKANKDRLERYYRKKYLIDEVLPAELDTTKSKESLDCERSVEEWFYHRGEKHG